MTCPGPLIVHATHPTQPLLVECVCGLIAVAYDSSELPDNHRHTESIAGGNTA